MAHACVVRLGRVIALALAVIAAPAVAQAQAPDTILVNGKVITVDDQWISGAQNYTPVRG